MSDDAAGDNARAITVDSRGTLCPQPVIDIARASAPLPPGSRVRLLADDPAATYDIPAWCRMRGHHLEHTATADGVLTFDVVLAGPAD